MTFRRRCGTTNKNYTRLTVLRVAEQVTMPQQQKNSSEPLSPQQQSRENFLKGLEQTKKSREQKGLFSPPQMLKRVQALQAAGKLVPLEQLLEAVKAAHQEQQAEQE